MSIHDKSWKYAPAAESAKPGYLRRKFERIRRELKEREQAEQQKVAQFPVRRAK